MSFSSRMTVAEAHERAVKVELERRGWFVQQYGQGILDERVRSALRKTGSFIRWHPDLIAVRDGDSTVVFVDAKAEQSQTENYAIELASLVALVAFRFTYGVPVVVVWEDMTCNTPDELQPHKWFMDTSGVKGSGTPFGLVRKVASHPMDAWFGRPLGEAA